MDKNFNFNELARDARRALDEERECLTEMARKVESYGQLLDAAKELAVENEELKDQLQEITAKLNEMNKLVAGVAKKSSQDEVLKAIRTFVNKSKQKTAKKRTLIKEMVLEFTFANGIALPEELAATVSALDDEQEVPTEVHNHFEAGSNSQVFNERVVGTFNGV
jgi:uncharacterized protein YukE